MLLVNTFIWLTSQAKLCRKMKNYANFPPKYVPVAQLDRVLASDAKGCEFEPRRVRHKNIAVCESRF